MRRSAKERLKKTLTEIASKRKQAQAYTREETKLAPIENVIKDARDAAK